MWPRFTNGSRRAWLKLTASSLGIDDDHESTVGVDQRPPTVQHDKTAQPAYQPARGLASKDPPRLANRVLGTLAGLALCILGVKVTAAYSIADSTYSRSESVLPQEHSAPNAQPTLLPPTSARRIPSPSLTPSLQQPPPTSTPQPTAINSPQSSLQPSGLPPPLLTPPSFKSPSPHPSVPRPLPPRMQSDPSPIAGAHQECLEITGADNRGLAMRQCVAGRPQQLFIIDGSLQSTFRVRSAFASSKCADVYTDNKQLNAFECHTPNFDGVANQEWALDSCAMCCARTSVRIPSCVRHVQSLMMIVRWAARAGRGGGRWCCQTCDRAVLTTATTST